jgi:sulfur dioxygenase
VWPIECNVAVLNVAQRGGYEMLFRQLFDAATSTYTYLLADPDSKEAVLIDSVIEQVDRDATLISELGLTLTYVLETHVHADHVTGAAMLKKRLGAKTVVGERCGMPFADVLAKQGEEIRFGAYGVSVRETPGHTCGCLSYVTLDRSMAFTGDALMIRGTGRTDFQQGDPHTLYRSVIEQIFTLPDKTFVYPAHDYKGRTVSTVGEEKKFNPRVGGGKTEAEFVAIMNNLVLAKPARIDIAVPANLWGGLSPAEIVTGDSASASSWAPLTRTGANVPEVEPAFAHESTGAVRIVDVREKDEFVGPLGHIPGAELVPMGTVENEAQKWDPRQPLVLVCRSGGRSGKAALALEAKGFKRVASMRGGMMLWNDQHLPIER